MDIRVRRTENVTIVELAGSLDISNVHQVRPVVVDATSTECAQIAVNLRDLYFVDSSGLAVLVQGWKRARAHHGNLCLYSVQPPVRMILELTRFDKVFEIFVREEDAVLAATSGY